MKSEVLFLKYAFPCVFIIKQRGEISQSEYEELERAAKEGSVVSRGVLERVFFRAFERIRRVAKSMGRDVWDVKVIREYFVKEHNRMIDEGMYAYAIAPDSLKELCKVHEARVVDVKGDVLIVEYGTGKRRPVMSVFVPSVKCGEKVFIHYGYAIERV